MYVSAGVTDGVTVGHPCCAILNCQEPLEKARDRYCPTHIACVDECAIEGCTEHTTRGFFTCVDPSHRAWEAKRRRRQKSTSGAAFTILSDRYHRAMHPEPVQPDKDASAAPSGSGDPSSATTPSRSPPDPVRQSQPYVISSNIALLTLSSCHLQVSQGHAEANPPMSSSPPPSMNRRQRRALAKNNRIESFKGRIYRRWTHNEQLFVCCCGIIKSRATFFGSEGPLGVIVSRTAYVVLSC